MNTTKKSKNSLIHEGLSNNSCCEPSLNLLTLIQGCSTEIKQQFQPLGKPVNIHVHTPGNTCPACAYLEQANMQEDFAALPFVEAFNLWLDAHHPFITDRTYRDYKQYGDALTAFLSHLQLRHISVGTIRGYQMWRWKRGEVIAGETQSKYCHSAETVRIKNELNSVLKPILRHAGLWAEIEKRKFKHLPVPRDGAGAALTKEQWRQIFEIAFSKKRWMLAGHCLQMMFRGGFGFGELRRVRRKDLDLAKGTIRIIEGAKNAGTRVRTVALVPSAVESARWLVARWVKLGGSDADSYLLPHRKTYHKALDRPMASINFAWNGIKAEWQKKYNIETDPRQYDARVSAATLLLQNPKLSLPTIEKALGWTPSSAMRKRYHRADLDIQRDALNTLEDVS